MPIAFLALHFSKLVYTSSARICHALCMLLGAFPVEFLVEIVLQKSVFLKLEYYLLISSLLATRFLMVQTVDCRNQKLIFDDDVSKCLSKL